MAGVEPKAASEIMGGPKRTMDAAETGHVTGIANAPAPAKGGAQDPGTVQDGLDVTKFMKKTNLTNRSLA